MPIWHWSEDGVRGVAFMRRERAHQHAGTCGPRNVYVYAPHVHVDTWTRYSIGVQIVLPNVLSTWTPCHGVHGHSRI